MKKLLLTAVSASALIVSGNAYAEMNKAEKTAGQSNAPVVTKEEINKGWKETKDAASKAAKSVSEATKEAYEDVRSAILDGKEVNTISNVQVNPKMAISNMIGQPIYNASNERVATVNDVIVDKTGAAKLIVLGDGNFTGLGKQVAYDYSMIAERGPDGEVFAPLSEEMIDQAASFSYDRQDAKSGVKVLPANGYSLDGILSGDIINPQSETLANIEDVVLDDGKIKYFVVGYNKTIGLGGDRAALQYADVKPVIKDGQIDLQLDAKKSVQFEVFKNTSIQPAAN